MSQARHGYGRYGYTTHGVSRLRYTGYPAPWYIHTRDGGIRADGLLSSDPPSPVVPGQTVTYTFVFRPQPPGGVSSDDHLARFRSARDLLVRAPDVVTYDPPGTEAHYREQHGAADGTQLVAIGPLPAAADGTTAEGELPPPRDSIHEPRWAVVTDGEARAVRPDVMATVTLEAVTLASTDTYGSRAAVRDAREHNGF